MTNPLFWGRVVKALRFINHFVIVRRINWNRLVTMPDASAQTRPADVLAGLSEQQRILLAMELSRQRAPRPTIERVPRGDLLPASFAQERLWFLEQRDPGTLAYLMPIAVRLRGPLRVPALADALTAVVARHECLRTSFVDLSGAPWQRIEDPAPVPLPVTDLAGRPAEAELAEALRHEASTPFELSAGPLLRARLLRVSDAEHLLLLTMHHIVSDGWSLGVLLRELADAYRRAATGQQPEPAAGELDYADYAAWQRSYLTAERLAPALSYWQQQLAGAPPLELPTDRPRTATGSWVGSAVPLAMPGELAEGLRRCAAAEQATPYMVLLAAVAVLLGRWSGQQDVVIGIPVAGREQVETEPMVGCFVNTLPIRLDLSGDPSFAELVRRTRDACLAGYAHQEVPFELIVREVRADRSVGPVPLARVMVALRNVPMPRLELAGLTVELVERESVSTKFDLCFDLAPEPDGGIGGRLEFNSDYFDTDSIAGKRDSFLLLARAAVQDPSLPISRLPLLTQAAQQQLVADFAGPADPAAVLTSGTLRSLFEDQVDRDPEAPALLFGGQRLSYAELDERANRLGHLLRELGVRPEQIVGVCLPRSIELVVALLAIHKAGAAYLPLDPNYPPQRLSLMIADSAVELVLTDGSVLDSGVLGQPDPSETSAERADPAVGAFRIDERVIATVRLDRGPGAGRPASRPPVTAGAQNLCYVIYTSGSTGTPKGAGDEHGGVANTLRGLQAAYELRPGDRMLAISSLNYDMSVYEIFATLAAGACIVLPDDLQAADPELLLELVLGGGVTTWSSAPAILDQLITHARSRPVPPRLALRLVGLAGDRIPPALPGRLADLVPGVRLMNLAGMTEVSYCSMFHEVDTSAPPVSNIPWGRPVANHRLLILDEHGVPVPPGVPGQLYIGGAGPGRGYWRRPALTAERFVPDPFAVAPGQRLYATGDHARWRSDGVVEFLGRLDRQIKIRGLRIEPGEIEVALAGHPAVAEAVVTIQRDRNDQQRLVSHLTVHGATAPTTSELRAFLSDRLPTHMVPDAFVVLDRLPLLPSGKLDRSALRLPAERPVLSSGYEEPADDLEFVLCGIWGDVLDVERVGVADDFFDLGGHSLLATRVVSQIREMFRVNLPIPDLLASATVRELAGSLREAGAREGVDVDLVAELVRQVTGTAPAEQT